MPDPQVNEPDPVKLPGSDRSIGRSSSTNLQLPPEEPKIEKTDRGL